MNFMRLNKSDQLNEANLKPDAKQASRSPDAKQIQRALEEPTQDNLSPDVVSDLQRLHGNQFVANMTSDSGNLRVQPKLTVTEAGDKHEQEADAMAQQVVSRMHDKSLQREGMEEEEMLQGKRDPSLQRMDEEEMMMKRDNSLQREEMPEEEEMMMKRDPSLQRMEEEEMLQGKRDPSLQRMEEEEMLQGKRDKSLQREEMPEEEEPLQMKASGDTMGGVTVSSDIEDQINQSRGGGNAIPDNVRDNMESGFGADFSGVRVHNDATADNLSRSVQAKAFTTGNDIFFQKGQYNPDSKSGQELLAHELTHTIQQGASQVSKKEDDNAS